MVMTACFLLAMIVMSLVVNGATPGKAFAQGTPVTSHDEQLEAAFAELEQSGIAAIVAISRDGGPITVREFGALREDGIPAASTQVDIGSLTKSVTGVMVLKLVEQGKVRLDETLAGIFPDVPADKATITIHQLLTHSAGFVDAVGDDAEPLSREDFLHRAFETQLLSTPGEQYNYSNVGFGILAAVIEVRSGKSYDLYLREDVLQGTGLDDIGYLSAYDDARSLRVPGTGAFPAAEGQSIMEASWGGHEPFWNLIGNGGLAATAEDFLQFRQLVAAGRIVPAELVEQSQEGYIAEDDAGTSYYGYGIVVQDVPGLGRVYWHDGGNDIFSAEWDDFVDQGDVIFTAAADSTAGDAFSAMAVIRRHLYGLSDE
jgi:CubicO group peptidase (beta-lactamase class C family)